MSASRPTFLSLTPPQKVKNIEIRGIGKKSPIFPLFPLRGPLGALDSVRDRFDYLRAAVG